MRKTILTAALLCAFLGTQAQEYYEKHVAFPAGATTAQKIDMASRLVPTRNSWHGNKWNSLVSFILVLIPLQAVNGEMVKKIRPFSILPNWIVNNG